MREQSSIFKQHSFDEQVNQIRLFILDYITHQDNELADRVIESITNNGELLSVIIEAVAAYTIDNTRKLNVEADQLSRLTVSTDDGIDRLVANNGLTRFVKHDDQGKLVEYESNHDLLTRFDLSHYQANTTGTRYGYKFHGLCYGINERPSISIEKKGSQIIQTFTYPQNDVSGVHDVEFRSIEPSSGKVIGAVTPKVGQTVDLNAMLLYVTRPDIMQETDKVSLKMAREKHFSLQVTAYTNNDPRYYIDKDELTQALTDFLNSMRKNGARITEYDLSFVAKSLGAYDIDISGINDALVCQWDEYPVCGGLTVNVMGKRP